MSRSTNNDLISRSVLLSALCTDCANGKISLEGCCKSGCEVVKLIRSIPTIEDEPLRHGNRIGSSNPRDYPFFFCSECRRIIGMNDRYCPHCGAKMDGVING